MLDILDLIRKAFSSIRIFGVVVSGSIVVAGFDVCCSQYSLCSSVSTIWPSVLFGTAVTTGVGVWSFHS